MALACVETELVAPLTMFKAIRTQMDEVSFAPDHLIHSLSELPAMIARP
jgi:2-haloacid dehalogenase